MALGKTAARTGPHRERGKVDERERRQLVLAYGIGTWATCYEHIQAMQAVGAHTPYAITAQVRSELRHLCTQWPGWEAGHGAVEKVVQQARAYCTARTDRLDRLLNEEEGRWGTSP